MADPKKDANSEGSEADVEDTEEFDSGDGSGFGDEENGENAPGAEGLYTLPLQRISNYELSSLPKCIRKRIRALKKLQLESTKLEARFYKEVHHLECKYASLYDPLYEKRCQIVTGQYQPNDEDCDFPSGGDTDDEKTEEPKNENRNSNRDAFDEADIKGIPGFWLTVLKNVDMLADLIQSYDEPVLEHLKDIVVKLSESNPMGFTLEFHFEPNDYFSNCVLTKKYEMICEVDELDPFSFDGPEIFKCQGCQIDWKPDRNVTVVTLRKVQRHKKSGCIRTIVRTIQSDSFFNFFNPPDPHGSEELEKSAQEILSADYEIGHFIRERLVPRAVLYFTGEAIDDDLEDLDNVEEELEPEDEEDASQHVRVAEFDA